MAAEWESERLFCNHTRQFLYFHWHLKFDKSHERRCTDLTLSSLNTYHCGEKIVKLKLIQKYLIFAN